MCARPRSKTGRSGSTSIGARSRCRRSCASSTPPAYSCRPSDCTGQAWMMSSSARRAARSARWRREAASRRMARLRSRFLDFHAQPGLGRDRRRPAAALSDPLRAAAEAARRDAWLSQRRRLQRFRARAAGPARVVRGGRRRFQPHRRVPDGRDREAARHACEPGGAAARKGAPRRAHDSAAVADPDPAGASFRPQHQRDRGRSRLALIALIGLLTASVAYAVALWTRSENSYAPIIFTSTLPILLLSGVLLPLGLAPPWLRSIAAANPLSYAVDAARAVFIGHLGDPSVVKGVVIMAVLCLISILLGARAFGRAVA